MEQKELEKELEEKRIEEVKKAKNKLCPVMGGCVCVADECMAWNKGHVSSHFNSIEETFYIAAYPGCNNPSITGFLHTNTDVRM